MVGWVLVHVVNNKRLISGKNGAHLSTVQEMKDILII